jgi:hypothetical protein
MTHSYIPISLGTFWRLKRHLRPDATQEALIAENVPKVSGGLPASAVGGPDSVDAQPTKRIHGFLYPCFICLDEMHASQYGVNPFVWGQMPNVLQRVYYTGMGAAKQDDKALRGLQKHRLIIQKQIRLVALWIQEEPSPGVFEVADAWDGTRYRYTGKDRGCCLDRFRSAFPVCLAKQKSRRFRALFRSRR